MTVQSSPRAAATSSRGAGAAPPARAYRNRRRTKELTWAAVFLAPALLAIATLRIAPSVEAIVSSLYSGFPGGVLEPVFSGLANYSDLFANDAFRATVVRTIVFNLIINPLQIAIALLIAVLMTRRIATPGLWRTLIFIPAVVPMVGSSIVWGIALRPEGPVNAIISALGGNPQPFLTSPDQALASIMLIISWIGIGYWMLFLISGLQTIPEEYYEAAKLDRAGPIRTFFQITIPLLKRPLLFVLVADTVANFVLFVPIQMLTNGGPQNSTTMQMFNAYRTTYTYGSKNLGAAEVVILTLIMLVFVAAQFRLLREDRAPRRRR
ncbi:binding-protein-dependent transport systems inner membrane component [Beutenbergia cavernae DSM 12333]|uniref:Binding-protein-dependent transport systems inner membrane component n=1 Tax=Beutenbergia cavernae (strain ATCC BAA-8 / DSM 12333 / CCUG 43141 / JCM 11478 / NBRC 16432 / NCIMB 13614 / HKI 0122) TaxID=471853 RepID=C5BW84_BEUC1|nr:sugar ABC transporter permease [Beutenbergia cavernae]ACQ78542.1 binding-protein-dependent transport systems inner membrane component [Beutenbergia cavernae DSM 12333]